MSLVQYLSRSVLDGLYPACCNAASSSAADARSSAVVSFTQRYAALDALTVFIDDAAAGCFAAGADPLPVIAAAAFLGCFAAAAAALAAAAAFLGDGIREAPPDAGIAS